MRIVIVGAGVAGISAAEELRRRDCTLEIAIVSDEKYYYRAALSKYFQGVISKDEVWGKPDNWYEANDINLRLGKAIRIDTEKKQVECAGGDTLPYDRMLIATGADPFVGDWPGLDLDGVCTYRGLECVEKFLRFVRAGAKHAVVIGGGILSFELIENFLKLGLKVTFVVRGSQLLNLLFDDVAAGIIESDLRTADVDMKFNTEAERFTGDNGRVTGVVTKGGDTIGCDIVAVAVGIKADGGLAEGSNIAFDRAVIVDEYLRTSAPDVYAAGDCCAIKTGESGARPTRTWLTSALQGRRAAGNMLGDERVFDEGVFFNVSHVFTSFYGVIGDFNPRDPEGFEFKSWRFSESSYMRWTLKSGIAVGAIIVNASRYIWPVRQMIESGVDVSAVAKGDPSPEELNLLLPQAAQTLF
ncbi:MAG: FAD-dependent oxidoreductase [Candidatus Eisenbacteria bacterium]